MAAAGSRDIGSWPQTAVVGVRFADASRVSYYRATEPGLEAGSWVVVPTSAGPRIARVVIAPNQVVLSQLDGDLPPVTRRADERDIERAVQQRRQTAETIRRVAGIAREHGFPITPHAAEFAVDGSALMIMYAAAESVDVPALCRVLEDELSVAVRMRQIPSREEGRRLGGLGPAGRTPMAHDMNARVRDPNRSLEHVRHTQAKANLPRLGQRVNTPAGDGLVVALEVPQARVTVRLAEDAREEVFLAAEVRSSLPLGAPRHAPEM